MDTDKHEIDAVLASKEVKELEGIETFHQLTKWFFNPLKMKPRTIIAILMIIAGLIIGLVRHNWIFFIVMLSLTILTKGLLFFQEWKMVRILKKYRNLEAEFDVLTSEDYLLLEKTDKGYLYQIMDLYLSDRISAKDFCDAFHSCYDIELDSYCLTRKEEEILNKYSSVFQRYSPIEEDRLLYPKTYIGESQLKEKVKEAKAELENLKK